MTSPFADPSENAIDLHIVAQADLETWLGQQSDPVCAWIDANSFTGALGQTLLIPDTDGKPAKAVAGYGSERTRARGRFHLAGAAAKLPKGAYRIASGLSEEDLAVEVLGWLLAAYRFQTYADGPKMSARLVQPDGIDVARICAQLDGETLTRDLINTPANDMGPAELEAAARHLAAKHGAEISVIEGDALLDQNFPLIHTVGRASSRAPRLIDIRRHAAGPKITLVGKGVCFDTGGLNLKPGASMGLMKKDMGGAANVLGLAHMLLQTNAQIDLRILIPAVENSVSGDAFRPGDILRSRKGLSVEINNTDAEGRLVLADALTLAQEDDPALIVSMATLTGAARVAVGPDLAPYYTDDGGFAAALESAGLTPRVRL